MQDVAQGSVSDSEKDKISEKNKKIFSHTYAEEDYSNGEKYCTSSSSTSGESEIIISEEEEEEEDISEVITYINLFSSSIFTLHAF